MVELYGVKLLDETRFIEMKNLLCAHLPDGSTKKAARFRFSAGVQRQIFGELMVRSILCAKYGYQNNQIHFEYSKNGKPLLNRSNNIHFNISHSGDWVVCAFSALQVGVDVEKVRNINFDIARRFYSDEEIALLFSLPENEQTEFFFDLWTLKESYLKALGTGLTKPLSSFTVKVVENNISLYDGNEKMAVSLEKIRLDKNHKLAVCGYESELPDYLEKLFIDDLLSMLQL
jgi:4'-phosphopantetheinyl transferase